MSRIQITLGSTRVEYEGDQEFIENKLLDFMASMLEMAPSPQEGEKLEQVPKTGPAPTTPSLSTNTIAQVLSAKTGADLVLAALARINIVRASGTATRQEILEEMKEATTYYKDSYASNLSTYLSTLVRNKRINLVSRSTYALAAAERDQLEQALADER